MTEKKSAQENGLFGALGRAADRVVKGRHALGKAKRAFRKSIHLENEVKRAKRQYEELLRKAEAAQTEAQRRRLEKAAERAYVRGLKASVKVDEAMARKKDAGLEYADVYANPQRKNLFAESDIAQAKKVRKLPQRGTLRRVKEKATGRTGTLVGSSKGWLKVKFDGFDVPHLVRRSGVVLGNPAERVAQQANPAPTAQEELMLTGWQRRMTELKKQTTAALKAGQSARAKSLLKKYAEAERARERVWKVIQARAARQQHNPSLATLGHLGGLIAAFPAGRELYSSVKKYLSQKKENPPRRPEGTKGTKHPANVARLFNEFQGRKNSGQVRSYFVPAGTPADVAHLGRLLEIKLADGRTLSFRKNLAALGGCGGETIRRLYVGLARPYRMPNGAEAGRAYDYGEVQHIVYRTAKPHVYGTNQEYEFIHRLGDEGGRRPRLMLHNGRLAFKGGDYTIKAEGVKN